MDNVKWYDLKKTANGMLCVEDYKKIYELSKSVKGNVVEVGAAHGASTITIALGLKNGKSNGKVYSFEKITGGTREEYGSYERNKNIIEKNLERWNVQDEVIMIYGDAGNNSNIQKVPSSLSMLVIDADGRIDRDFENFYNRLEPGAPIIIDDCDDRLKLEKSMLGKVEVDLKHKITNKLVEMFRSKGIIEEGKFLGNTLYTKKPLGQKENIKFSKGDVLKVYYDLVFTKGEIRSSLRKSLSKFMQNYPKVKRNLKKIANKVF